MRMTFERGAGVYYWIALVFTILFAAAVLL